MPFKIAENARAMVLSLFNSGGTDSGYVVKRGKFYCDVMIGAEPYRINKWGVFCRSYTVDGVTRWTFADLGPGVKYSEERAAADALAVETGYEPGPAGEKWHRFK